MLESSGERHNSRYNTKIVQSGGGHVLGWGFIKRDVRWTF